MMDFDVTGILKENGAYHQPHQQPKRSRGAYFYLFDHIRSVMITQMFNVRVCVYASANTGHPCVRLLLMIKGKR